MKRKSKLARGAWQRVVQRLRILQKKHPERSFRVKSVYSSPDECVCLFHGYKIQVKHWKRRLLIFSGYLTIEEIKLDNKCGYEYV